MIRPAFLPVVARLLALNLFITLVNAVPSFSYGLRQWDGIGRAIRALRLDAVDSSLYLHSTAPRGEIGNVIIADQQFSPFHVHGGVLYQVTNSSHVLYTNVMNTTDPNAYHHGPSQQYRLRLELSERRGGLSGVWSWSESKALQYSFDGASNAGMFHSCTSDDRVHGLYLDLITSPNGKRGRSPPGCTPITLNAVGN